MRAENTWREAARKNRSSPTLSFERYLMYLSYILVGIYYAEDPPVPIPNTEVKLMRAENTWREAAWKDRSLPTL